MTCAVNPAGDLAHRHAWLDGGCGVVGCSFQTSRASGPAFAAKDSSLAIGDGRKAWRDGARTLFGSSSRSSRGRSRPHPARCGSAPSWRPCGVRPRKRGGLGRAFVTSSAKTFSSIRSQMLNKKRPPVSDSSGFSVAGRAVGKDHRAGLTADEIEGRIVTSSLRSPGAGRTLSRPPDAHDRQGAGPVERSIPDLAPRTLQVERRQIERGGAEAQPFSHLRPPELEAYRSLMRARRLRRGARRGIRAGGASRS